MDIKIISDWILNETLNLDRNSLFHKTVHNIKYIMIDNI